MIKRDYSSNAELLWEEKLDFDTKFQNETGINENRMRLPTRYDISKFYKRNKRPSSYDELGNPRYEKGKWTKKDPKEVLDFSKDFDWQITYNFPETIRDAYNTPSGVKYGGRNVTYRRLYLILCERFNNGQFFIDQYFNELYPARMKAEVDKELEKVKFDLINYADALLEGYVDEEKNLKRGAKQRIREYKSFAREWEDLIGTELASKIKEDIIISIETGALPCQMFSPSKTTMRERKKAGITSVHLFSATHQLIRSIQLYVKIGGKNNWQTQSGIQV